MLVTMVNQLTAVYEQNCLYKFLYLIDIMILAPVSPLRVSFTHGVSNTKRPIEIHGARTVSWHAASQR